jgi:hypothetical protein
MSEIKRDGLVLITNTFGKSKVILSDAFGTLDNSFKTRLLAESVLCNLKGSIEFHDTDYAQNFLKYNTSDNLGLGIMGADIVPKRQNYFPFTTLTGDWNPTKEGPPSTEGWGVWNYNAWSGNVPSSGILTSNAAEPPVSPSPSQPDGYLRLAYDYPVRYNGSSYQRVPFFHSTRWISIKNLSGTNLSSLSNTEIKFDIPKSTFDGCLNFGIDDVPRDLRFYSHPKLVQSYSSNVWEVISIPSTYEQLSVINFKVEVKDNLTYTISLNLNIFDGVTYSLTNNKYWHIAVYWKSKDVMPSNTYLNLATDYIATDLIIGNRKNFFDKNILTAINFNLTGINDLNKYLYSDNKTLFKYLDGEFSNPTSPSRYLLTDIPNTINNSLSELGALRDNEFKFVNILTLNNGSDGFSPSAQFLIQHSPAINGEFIEDLEDSVFYPEYSSDYDLVARAIITKSVNKYGLAESSSIQVKNEIVFFEQIVKNFAKNKTSDIDIAETITPAYITFVNELRQTDFNELVENGFYDSFYTAIDGDTYNLGSLSEIKTDINYQKIIHYLLKKPTQSDLQNTNNAEPKSIQLDRYGRQSVYDLTFVQPSTILGSLYSNRLELSSELISNEVNVEIYQEQSFLCESVDVKSAGNKIGQDYTLRMEFQDSSKNVLKKDLGIMASKYFLSDDDYDKRVANSLSTIGYFKLSTLQNINDFRLHGYAALIPDLEMGKSQKVLTKVVSPPDSTKITEEAFRLNLANQGNTEEQINEKVLRFIEAGGEFYVVDYSQYPNTWVSLKNLAISYSEYTNSVSSYWKNNLPQRFGYKPIQADDPAPLIEKIVADSFTIAETGYTLSNISELENHGNRKTTIDDLNLNNVLGGTSLLLAKYTAIKLNPQINSSLQFSKVNLKITLNSGKTKLLNADVSEIKAYIYSNVNNLPAENLKSGTSISFSELTTSFVGYEFKLDYNLNSGYDYWIVLELSSLPIDGNIYIEVLNSGLNIAQPNANDEWILGTGTPVLNCYKKPVEIFGAFNRDESNVLESLPPPNQYRSSGQLYYVDGYASFTCKKFDTPKVLAFYPRAFVNNSSVWQYAACSNDIYVAIRYKQNDRIISETKKIFSKSPKWRTKWWQRNQENYHIINELDEVLLDVIDFEINYPNANDLLDNAATYLNSVTTGSFVPLFSESYTFNFAVSGGLRVYIDNVLVIDQWNNIVDSTFTFSKQLLTTQEYKIKLEFSYTNLTVSGSAIKFIARWSSVSQSLALINYNSAFNPSLNPVLISSDPIDSLIYLRVGKSLEELDTPTDGAPPGDRIVIRTV